MRGAVLRGVSELLEVRDDLQVVPPGPGEVKLRVHASGVCHSDVSAQNGTIPVQMPIVLGHEGAGVVTEVGKGVTTLGEGDHVIIAWVTPCGHCTFCLTGQANLCTGGTNPSPRFSLAGDPVYGFAGTGTFAEELVVPAEAAIRIADDIPLDLASLIGCGVMTGVGAALNTAKVRPGSSVIVFGCGGVGVSIIQGARIAGAAEIVAVDRVANKLEAARRFGATHAVGADQLADVKMEVTSGVGFDYAFEAIGSPQTIRAAYDAARRGGMAVIVGVGRTTEQVQFSAFELFHGEKDLKGSLYGSGDVRTDFDRLIRLWRSGRLDLEGMISRRIGLSDVNEAFEAIQRGEAIRSVIEFSRA
ncbi:MAG TPA: Zn-dependent alcohol dehydrogenase [Acidimicrobiales bacterium]|nr:Zn-dependent alcohol dehydrogenase [Acidimicrobiales bacterium]